MSEEGLKKRLLFALIPAFIALLAGFISLEIYIRFFSEAGYITPELLRDRLLQYEPSLFSRYVFPQKEHWAEGYNHIRYYINEKGYRGHNFEVKKPKGIIRIIFYGGSAVFDQAVEEGKDWPHRVERILKEEGFSNIEVINAGVPGSATFDSLGRFFAEGHFLEPDYVVLYNAWNDFEYFTKQEPILRQFHPYSAYQDPRLQYQGRLDQFLCKYSQVYVRLRFRYYNWKLRIGPEGARPKGELTDRITEEALRQYRINVEMFVDLAKNIGAQPVLMIQARLISPSNTEEEKKRIQYQYALLNHSGLVQAFSTTDQILREVAREKGALLIDADRELSGRGDLFIDQIHLNDQGSEALAKFTAGELEKILKERLSKVESSP